jgi:hypothetical protein
MVSQLSNRNLGHGGNCITCETLLLRPPRALSTLDERSGRASTHRKPRARDAARVGGFDIPPGLPARTSAALEHRSFWQHLPHERAGNRPLGGNGSANPPPHRSPRDGHGLHLDRRPIHRTWDIALGPTQPSRKLALDDDVPVALGIHLQVVGSAPVLGGHVRSLCPQRVGGDIGRGAVGVVDKDLEVALRSKVGAVVGPVSRSSNHCSGC